MTERHNKTNKQHKHICWTHVFDWSFYQRNTTIPTQLHRHNFACHGFQHRWIGLHAAFAVSIEFISKGPYHTSMHQQSHDIPHCKATVVEVMVLHETNICLVHKLDFNTLSSSDVVTTSTKWSAFKHVSLNWGNMAIVFCVNK